MNKLFPIGIAGVLDVSTQRHPDVRFLHRDYEVRSRLDLKRVGTHKYAADPSTEVLCCAFAVDEQPIQLWIPPDRVPLEIVEVAANLKWSAVATVITSKQQSSGTSWRRALAGRRFRSSDTCK